MIQKITTLIHYIIVIILLILAINLKSPYLLWCRGYLFFVIVLILFGYSWYFSRFSKILLALIAAVILIVGFNEVRFIIHKYKTLSSSNEILKKLSPHIIVGYKNIEDVEQLILKDAIAGIFITARNVEGKSYDQVKEEIAKLQKIRAFRKMPKLIITTDQEGGIVSRLSPPLSKFPPLSSLSQLLEKQQIIEAQKYGERQGQELSGLGIDVNFSPVVDIKYNDEINPLDFHSLINQRSISNDKSIVSNIALAYVLGLEKHNVIATVKHFPGIGRVKNDTHHFGANLKTRRELLEKTDWVPFKYILSKSNAFMMLSHVVASDIDNSNQVSSSKIIINKIIRNEWKHDGILITDDLTMNAIYGGKNGICKSSILSLNAGVDFLLISYDFEKYYDVMYCLINSYLKNELDKNMLDKSQERISRQFFK